MFRLLWLLLVISTLLRESFAVCDSIVLKPQYSQPVYATWRNVTTKLICPSGTHNTSIWYSPLAVYRMVVSCGNLDENSLLLSSFPNVPLITAIMRSAEKSTQVKCIFTLIYGILKAEMIQEYYPSQLANNLSVVVHFVPNAIITNVFYICKHGEVYNGTCHHRSADGTFHTGKQLIHTTNNYHRVTFEFTPEEMDSHTCQARVNGTFYEISVLLKEDIDACAKADELGVKVCNTGDCIDRGPGYECSTEDYADNALCKDSPDWFCPNYASYRYMSSDECEVNRCVEAANHGYELCNMGVYDCQHVEGSYRCRRGVPLPHQCSSLKPVANWSCPTPTMNVKNRGETKLVSTSQMPYLTDEETLRSAEGLMNSLGMALGSPWKHQSEADRFSLIELPSANPNERLNSASNYLGQLATLARQNSAVSNRLKSGNAVRNRITFEHLTPGHLNTKLIGYRGTVIELSIIPKDKDDINDAVIAAVPGDMLISTETGANDTDGTVVEYSDVVIIDTIDEMSTYSLTMNMITKPNKSVACHQFQKSSGNWSKDRCKTVVVGLRYECRCNPLVKGTFAIGLIYWIGGENIPIEQAQVVTFINYLSDIITIIALILFLLFTRYVGVFRLDQFNIAFCLLLNAIFLLGLPQVNDDYKVWCVLIAVAVCYFPLAAFCWKLLFGLNTLILIVAPQSRYHDIVSRQRHCLLMVCVGYLVPAIIIAAWFGYVGKVSTRKMCIGPSMLRWAFIGPITGIVCFNFIVLVIVAFVLMRSYLLTRKSRLNKSTHLLVLTQLSITFGIPYLAIYLQLVDPNSLLIIVPVAMALTAVLMFLLVAVVDEENRHLLQSFIQTHLTLPFRTSQSRGRGNVTTTVSGSLVGTDNWSSHFPADNNNTNGKSKNHSLGQMHESDNTGRKQKQKGSKKKGGALSETNNPDLYFEPGWLHRQPAIILNNGQANLNSENDTTLINDSTDKVQYPVVYKTAF